MWEGHCTAFAHSPPERPGVRRPFPRKGGFPGKTIFSSRSKPALEARCGDNTMNNTMKRWFLASPLIGFIIVGLLGTGFFGFFFFAHTWTGVGIAFLVFGTIGVLMQWEGESAWKTFWGLVVGAVVIVAIYFDL
jgi:hypothetical protein